jgi:hypothetical protein
MWKRYKALDDVDVQYVWRFLREHNIGNYSPLCDVVTRV